MDKIDEQKEDVEKENLPTTSKDVNQVTSQIAVSSINNVNLLDEKQLAAAKVFITQIMRSKKGGITSIEDGLAVLMRAQDLHLPFTACLENIHVVNGKTGIDIHLIKALLLKAGTITWECTKDYVPLYEYTDGYSVYVENKLPTDAIKCKNKADAEAKQKEDDNHIYVYPVLYYQDYNGNIYKSSQWNNALAIAMNAQHAKELTANKKIPVFRIPNQPVDYITEYRMERKIAGKVMISVGHFSYSEAVAAGMFDKDTYVKYGRIMIGHRAFTYCSRDIASDLLMGCMETTELKQINNIDITDADIVEL